MKFDPTELDPNAKPTIESLSFAGLKTLFRTLGMPESTFNMLKTKHRKPISPEPKGYISPDTVAKFLISNAIFKEPNDMGIADRATLITMSALTEEIYPTYWLNENLAQALDMTTPPLAIPDDLIFPPIGVLVLPRDMIETVTGHVNLIAYRLFAPGETIEFRLGVNDGGKPLRVATQFDSQTDRRLAWFAPEDEYNYGGIIGLNQGDHEFTIEREYNDPLFDPEAEKDDENRIVALLLNVLTYTSQVESLPPIVRKRKGFGKGKEAEKIHESPLIVGQTYPKPQIIYEGEKGTHGSPRPHWRKGHWRRFPVGQGRTDRKWRLVKPKLVSLSK